MIFRSQNPLSPTVEITIGNVPVDYSRIVQIEMELTENQHDMVKIVMAGLPPQAITDYVNAPVSLSWFQDSMGHNFKGYIVFLDPEYKNNQGLVNNSPFQLTTAYCFGASFDMSAKVTKSWDKVTIMNIVEELANKYQYSYSVPEDPFTYTRLVQSEESDWAFLVRVCDSLGYSVTLHETHIHVFDRYRATGRQISVHLLETGRLMSNPKVRPGQVLSFRGSFGQITPHSTSNDEIISALDSQGNTVTVETQERYSGLGRSLPARFKDQLAVNLVSPDYAEGLLVARTRAKFPFKVTAELTGTAGIKPGGVVEVRKFNSNFDGLWYVSSVCQTITLDKFFTEITILRDSTSEDPFIIAGASAAKEPPPSVFLNGVWCARNEMSEVYA